MQKLVLWLAVSPAVSLASLGWRRVFSACSLGLLTYLLLAGYVFLLEGFATAARLVFFFFLSFSFSLHGACISCRPL
jgi:hypothetical protein